MQGGFITIVTNKDIIILKRESGERLFESEYYEYIKASDTENQKAKSNVAMRDVLQFKLISSDMTIRDN